MATEGNACSKCGATNLRSMKFCSACGEPLAAAAESRAGKLPLQWKWVAIGAVAVFVVQFGIGFLLASVVGADIATNPKSLALLVPASLVGYFLTGVGVAYRSPGLTLREPAFGAAIAVAATNLVSANLGSLAIAWVLPFFVTLFGAKVGEKWQAKSQLTASGTNG